MKIIVDGVEYRCKWKSYGFSYACPVVKKRSTFLGYPCWRKWSMDGVVANAYYAGHVGQMKPDEMRKKFTDAIKRQRDYYDAKVIDAAENGRATDEKGQ